MRTLMALIFTTLFPLSLFAEKPTSIGNSKASVFPLSESTNVALFYTGPDQEECLIPLNTDSAEHIQAHLLRQRPDLYLATRKTQGERGEFTDEKEAEETVLAEFSICSENITEQVNANPYAFLGGTETAALGLAGALATYYLACTGVHLATESLDSLTDYERATHNWSRHTQHQVSYLGKWTSAVLCVIPTAINYGVRMAFFGPSEVSGKFPVAPIRFK
jgi:hypothetical protein